MKRAGVFVGGTLAGELEELQKRKRYRFIYREGYDGPPISLSMPVIQKVYNFDQFPPFFDGLLPEGVQLEGLLRQAKLDRHDYFSQLVAVGADMVGAVTVKEAK
jgi:serine/threonine-protein kinase HipA